MGTALVTRRAAGGAAARGHGEAIDAVRAPRPRSWLSLLVTTRLLAAGLAFALLAVHHVTGRDPALMALTVAWTVASLAVVERSERAQRLPAAWVVDAAAALGLVWLSGDWRSPFYVYALTTLVLPATALRFRAAVLWGGGFTVLY